VPAAAVIPAPIAYIKVVAVKKLVVGFQFNLWGPSKKGLLGVMQGPGILHGIAWPRSPHLPGGYYHSV
jgi:hypothetical protein